MVYLSRSTASPETATKHGICPDAATSKQHTESPDQQTAKLAKADDIRLNRGNSNQLTSVSRLPTNFCWLSEPRGHCEGHPVGLRDERTLAQQEALETNVVRQLCEIHCEADRSHEVSNPWTARCPDPETDRSAHTLHSQPEGTRCTTTGNECSGRSCIRTSPTTHHRQQTRRAVVEATNGLSSICIPAELL